MKRNIFHYDGSVKAFVDEKGNPLFLNVPLGGDIKEAFNAGWEKGYEDAKKEFCYELLKSSENNQK